MGRKRTGFGVAAILAAFNLPGCVKLADATLTAYTAPADASALFMSLLKAVEAISRWPLWLAITFSLGSLGLYAVYLFGADGLLRAWRFIFKQEARLADLGALADDARIQTLADSLFAQNVLANGNWEPFAQILPPPGGPPEDPKLRAKFDAMRASAARLNFQEVSGQIATRVRSLGPPNRKTQGLIDRIVAAGNDAASAPDAILAAKGAYFPDEATRVTWNAARGQIDQANIVLEELAEGYRTMANRWRALDLTDGSVADLLDEIGARGPDRT